MYDALTDSGQIVVRVCDIERHAKYHAAISARASHVTALAGNACFYVLGDQPSGLRTKLFYDDQSRIVSVLMPVPHVLTLRFPNAVKSLLPAAALRGIRSVKARILSRGLKTDCEFIQSAEDASASATMSVVVPIHDSPVVTKRCLASLCLFAPQAEIILIDDGSQLAETKELIRSYATANHWTTITNEQAKGHTHACNAGAQSATRPYLCLLNSDTVATPWCWRLVKEAFENEVSIGVAGPSTSQSWTQQTLGIPQYCRLYWNDSQVVSFAEKLMRRPPFQVPVDMEWVSGFAFFVRRSLWQTLGGFDRNIPDYGNEVEFCLRVAKSGCRIVWVPNSYIHHVGRQSYESALGDREMSKRAQCAHEYIRKKHLTDQSFC
jgi:GT2 family glycosyltransferase